MRSCLEAPAAEMTAPVRAQGRALLTLLPCVRSLAQQKWTLNYNKGAHHAIEFYGHVSISLNCYSFTSLVHLLQTGRHCLTPAA